MKETCFQKLSLTRKAFVGHEVMSKDDVIAWTKYLNVQYYETIVMKKKIPDDYIY